MYVEKLQIRNFRNFAETEMTLNYPDRIYKGESGTNSNGADGSASLLLPNVNLFVGDNGAGKTSVFRALCLALLGSILNASGFQADYLVRRAPKLSSSKETALLEEYAYAFARIKLYEIDDPFRAYAMRVLNASGNVALRRMGDVEQIDGLLTYAGAEQIFSETVFVKNLLHEAFSGKSGIVVRALNEKLSQDNSPTYFLVGYGTNRRTERPEGFSEQNRRLRYRRVAGLFEEHMGLVPFTYGYLQLETLGYVDEARELLNELLSADPQNTIQLTDRRDSDLRPLFDRDGVLLPFNALSDGFRTFVGWIWDMLVHIARVQPKDNQENRPKLADMTGVVIVDEIDLFLHPEWQRTVVPSVAKTFPNLQFLFSSHSPLVAGGLQPQNLYVLETEGDGTSVVKQYDEDIYGLTTNQVLTSSYFGLRSTRAPGTGTLTDLVKSATQNNGVHHLASNATNESTEQAEPKDRLLDLPPATLKSLEEIADDEALP